MPVDMSKYPAEWPQIRARSRMRAGNRCEQCGIPNGHYRFIWSDKDGSGESHHRYAEKHEDQWCGYDSVNGDNEPVGEAWYDRKPARIVLTIAHITDPDPMNCADHNLKALCQRCHLRHDAKLHRQHAAATRRRRQVERGQHELPL